MDDMTHRTLNSIQARDTLIFIETIEEKEVMNQIQSLAKAMGSSIICWNPVEKFHDLTPEDGPKVIAPVEDVETLNGMLNEISCCL